MKSKLIRQIFGSLGRPFVAMLVLVLAASPGVAQQRGGSLSGAVTDETGAAVSDAVVALVDGSGTPIERTTDDRGRFAFRNVPAGLYTLRVTAAGFAELEPLLSQALADERADKETHELAVTAQGIAKAAEILASQFTLVATNVPYLGRGKQDEVLKYQVDQETTMTTTKPEFVEKVAYEDHSRKNHRVVSVDSSQ